MLTGDFRNPALSEECPDIVFHRADTRNAEVFHQHFRHGGRKEGGQGRAEMDVFHAQRQQGQQYDHGLLLVPGDIVHDGQPVHVIQTEGVLERKSRDHQGIGIVALAGVEYARDAR